MNTKSALCLSIAFLSLSLFYSCKTTHHDPREDLVQSLKGANVDGYFFGTEEDDAQFVASLTNPAVRDVINLDRSASGVILRYTSVKDKKTNATTTYKTEIVRSGTELTLQASNIATGEAVIKEGFRAPEPRPGASCGPPVFNSLKDCFANFDCTQRGAIQCEANRTCKDQFADIDCCLSNGLIVSVLLIIKPTSPICQLRQLVPDLSGFVFTQ